ncbi:hypothetical protein SBA2_100053 [Acidobacteriia bacterium SbA2]|nr:hypothetical protein SBA2_100053 [Acidobacteriia bacterium SbA2]
MPLTQHNFITALRDLYLLRAKTEPLGNPHRLTVAALKDLGDSHGLKYTRDVYTTQG